MSTLETLNRITADRDRCLLAAPRAAALLDRIHEAKQDAKGQTLTDLESMRLAVAGFVVYGKDCSEEGERFFSNRLDKLTDTYVNDPRVDFDATEKPSPEEERIETLEAALEMATDALRKLDEGRCDAVGHGNCDKGCQYVAYGALSEIKAFLRERGAE